MKDLNYYSNEYYKRLAEYKTAETEKEKENLIKDLNLLENLIIDRLETYKKLRGIT